MIENTLGTLFLLGLFTALVLWVYFKHRNIKPVETASTETIEQDLMGDDNT